MEYEGHKCGKFMARLFQKHFRMPSCLFPYFFNVAIKSSKSKDQNERVISSDGKESDLQNDIKLRPKSLDDYVGQNSIKKHLKIAIESAKIRNEPLEHILLY